MMALETDRAQSGLLKFARDLPRLPSAKSKPENVLTEAKIGLQAIKEATGRGKALETQSQSV